MDTLCFLLEKKRGEGEWRRLLLGGRLVEQMRLGLFCEH